MGTFNTRAPTPLSLLGGIAPIAETSCDGDNLRRTQTAMNEAWTLFKQEEECRSDHSGSAYIFYRDSPVRILWSAAIALLLIYTGTIFIYRLCFVELRMRPDGEEYVEEPSWIVIDNIVNVLFWIDLFANFFFTADGVNGKEINTLKGVASAYLRSHFIINFLACIPTEWVELAISSTSTSSGGSDFNQSLRTLRLQRVSRLARLVRLTRLGKLSRYKDNSIVQWFQRSKGVRTLNLICFLIFVIHLHACGWYLCAVLHDDHETTWVQRRTVDAAGEVALMESPPFDQYLQSFYYVITVFSTVGFGDMSAFTTGEIIFTMELMLVGAVVHSIIISEVINVVTSSDEGHAFVTAKVELIDSFAEHAEVEKETHLEFRGWLLSSARQWMNNQYDKEKMKEIITGKYLPRELLGRLPNALFDGKLVDNRIFNSCRVLNAVPPRLPTLLAIASNPLQCVEKELIYKVSDFPFNLFLVLSGTFAYVAYPSESGGLPASDSSMEIRTRRARTMASKKGDAKSTTLSTLFRGEAEPEEDNNIDETDLNLHPYQLFSKGSYFGDLELFQNCPRHTTARCESTQGGCLSLRKKDLINLVEEFPQFGALGKISAMNSSTMRLQRQKALTKGLKYTELAASIIQRQARRKVARRASSGLGAAAGNLGTAAMDAAVGQALFAHKSLSTEQLDVRRRGKRDPAAEVQDLQAVVDGMSSQVEALLKKLSGKKVGHC